MFSTRSPARPEPAIDWREGTALLLIGHGSGNTQASDSMLSRHADALRRSGMLADVGVAPLSDGRQLEQVCATLAGGAVAVLPFFMCDGHMMKAAIPSGAAGTCPTIGRPVRLYPPLGLAPWLTELIVERATARAGAAGIAPGKATLALVAHGSPKNPASRWAAERHVRRAATSSALRQVAAAYLDEAPRLAEVLAALPGPVIVCGLFVENGVHAARDVPDAIRRAGRGDVYYLGAIGADPEIPAQILRWVGPSEFHRIACSEAP